MNLFGFKARREPARPVLARPYAAVLGGGIGGEAPRGYEVQVRDAYVANPVAQRACRLVAEALGGAPLTASDPALLALVQASSAGQGLLESCAMQLMLHGNAYIQIISDGAGQVRELFALRPDRVTVEADVQGWPVAYAYRAGGRAVRLPAEDGAGRPAVVHVKTMHPLDDHYGLGCLSAAASAIAVHNAAARWNRALLDNAARPSGALVYDPGEPGATLSPAQFERLKAEMEANFAGSANAGRPMLLEGGLKWQTMSLSPADMDFVGVKAAAAREIAMAFGVPPMLLGVPGDATYANYREASRALWRLTILPLAGKLLGAIAQGLAPWFADARLTVDLDRVTALAEDRERLWSQLSAADFLSADEKRAMLGLEARA